MAISSLNIKLLTNRLDSEARRTYSEQLRLMAGYRNRLVHFYDEVSEKELFQILRNNLGDIEEFVRQIAAFLQKYRQTQRPSL
jgi:uncharacterized protein YutE (UPF0331/DUF86 family)